MTYQLEKNLIRSFFRKDLLLIFALLFLICLLPGTGVCAEIEKKLDFTLPTPKNNIHKTYLGLMNTDRFSLGQIKADIVIIEIFSMYCPVCQREAGNVNDLFKHIQKRSPSEKKIKMIGIGAGNSPFEVNFFKKKYGIEFPLFGDPDFVIHNKIGSVRTPHFIGLTIIDKYKFKVFYSNSSDVSNPEKFLKTILKNLPPGK